MMHHGFFFDAPEERPRLTWRLVQRVVTYARLDRRRGEAGVFGLRPALSPPLHRMSLGFFTHTKVGELMSRLNNDVVGAQNAISNTLVGILTNIIQAAAV